MSEDFTLEHLLHEAAGERGVDFRGYKRSTLERRIRKRMFEVKCPDYGDYAGYLRSHPDEVNDLLNTVLINVTEFFRDPQIWEALRRSSATHRSGRRCGARYCPSCSGDASPAMPSAAGARAALREKKPTPSRWLCGMCCPMETEMPTATTPPEHHCESKSDDHL